MSAGLPPIRPADLLTGRPESVSSPTSASQCPGWAQCHCQLPGGSTCPCQRQKSRCLCHLVMWARTRRWTRRAFWSKGQGHRARTCWRNSCPAQSAPRLTIWRTPWPRNLTVADLRTALWAAGPETRRAIATPSNRGIVTANTGRLHFVKESGFKRKALHLGLLRTPGICALQRGSAPIASCRAGPR
jgi:hypothetical protein